MAAIKVNPTRMELKRLKGQLATARRGHKLLKDKCDELMRRFLDAVREAKELREKLSVTLGDVDGRFSIAAAQTDPRMMTAALMLPAGGGELSVGEENIMSVIVPRYEFCYDQGKSASPSGFAFTTSARMSLRTCFRSLCTSLSLKRPRFFCAMRSNVPAAA